MLPKCDKNQNLQIQKMQWTPKRMNKKTLARHIIIKVLKIKVLKVAKETIFYTKKYWFK